MNIVILSYRISGNDGVSLECKHWAKILRRMGHRVSFVAGELDVEGELIPHLHFQWPNVVEIHDKVVYGKSKFKEIEEEIFDIAGTIEGKLRKYLQKKKIDLLILANTFSLPMHFPLAVALKRIIEEYQIPTIAKHYDFWWERQRFLKSRLFPFFKKWYPPNLSVIRHVVINSRAQKELKKRCGIEAVISHDSFDFTNESMAKTDSYVKSFRRDFGLTPKDIVFLQSTRIIPRKRIELSIKLLQKLANPNAVLLIVGKSGDEGKEYEAKIRTLAEQSGIRFMFIGDRVGSRRKLIQVANGHEPKNYKIYTLWDCYKNADFVTYTPEIEGFGNNFIEAIYFRKPVVLTEYPVYKDDIAPLKLQVIEMTPKIGYSTVRHINKLIKNGELITDMVNYNFEIGKREFSYEHTANILEQLILSFKFDDRLSNSSF